MINKYVLIGYAIPHQATKRAYLLRLSRNALRCWAGLRQHIITTVFNEVEHVDCC